MKKELQCPWCNGSGGWREIIDRELGGPWMECGTCRGEGKLTRDKFYMALGYLSASKRKR